MPDLIPAQLTPEEQAEFDKAAPAAPAPQTSVLQGLSAPELAELAVKDKDNFDLVNEFRQNQDLWQNPEVVQKVADAHNLIRQRGFTFADLPGPGKVAKQVFDVGRGLVKQAWNYASAGVNAGLGVFTEPGTTDELVKDAQQRVAENFSGTEQAVTGLGNMAEKGVKKIVSKLPGTKTPADLTPEERVKDLWDAVGKGETEQDISKGHGAFMQAVGGNVISDLENEGKGVRPEEVAKLAPGDPFSFWAFGKLMQAGGKVASAAAPDVLKGAIAKAGTTISDAAPKVGGAAIEKTGDALQATAKATATGGKVVLPVAGAVTGAVKGGPLGVLPGIAGGQVAAKSVAKVAGGAEKIGAKVSDLGQQVSGAKPVVSPYAQLAKDTLESAPGVAADVGKGVATDIGVAAVTAENPQDTQSVGLGAAIGAGHGALKAFGHAVSGQIIAPRSYGSNVVTPASGNHPALNQMHSQALQAAAPGVVQRLNAIRQFVASNAPGTDVYLAKDGPSLQTALEKSGMPSDQAAQWADQEGFFSVSFPDKNGQPSRVIVAKNIESAPHESFHAIQDVLGETANRQIDEIVKQNYANEWDHEGQRYADRLTGKPEENWRDTVLDVSGWGRSEAVEKLYQQLANKTRVETGAEPNPGLIRDLVQGEWNNRIEAATKANPGVSPEQVQAQVWRDILTPEEAHAASDRYLARELAAENFDMVFKHGPEGKSLPERLARIVANVQSSLGANPLSDRKSEIAEVTPKFKVTEAVKKVSPLPEAPADKTSSGPAPRPSSTSPAPAPSPADEARTIADEAPDTAPPGRTSSPREILGTVAEAIAQQSGVKINYHSAPDEPAAAVSANRETRRAVIEAFRSMPKSARSLWEKNFFPERVMKTRDGYQIMGWAPEVFAANAHRVAQALGEVDTKLSPYEIKDGTFTDAGWQELFKDAQRFVENQMAGRTGAGESLVVPKESLDRGFFKPAERGAVKGLDQGRADFINLLFGFRLPDSGRISGPGLSLAGQEVSEATAPGRAQIPVRPRQPFQGKRAVQLGVEGQDVKEVNPVRNDIERAMLAAGKAMPSLVEAIQRLNVENIADVQLAPEQPQFRGNTLALTAGFQPPTEEQRKSGKEFIEAPAVKMPTGEIYKGAAYHGDAIQKAMEAGHYDFDNAVDGFVTNEGRFLNREESYKMAVETGQMKAEDFKNRGGQKSQKLESTIFREVRQFQPKVEPPKDKEYILRAAKQLKDGTLLEGSYHDELKESERGKLGFLTSKGRFVNRAEAFDIAENADQIDKEKISDKGKSRLLHSGDFQFARQFQPKSSAEHMDSLKDEKTWDEIKNWPAGKFGGGLTGWAFERGAEAKTPEDIAAFRSADQHYSGLVREAIAARDFDAASKYMGRAQAAHEAYQAATGVNRDGVLQGADFIQKHFDKSYQPPVPDPNYLKSQENKQVPGIDKGTVSGDNSSMIQAQPIKANDDIHALAEEYSRSRGIEYAPARNSVPVNEDLAKKLADHYEAEKSNPKDEKVQASYKALAEETLAQYRAIANAGYEIEPWTGKGEPYKSSADMSSDIRDNKHLYYLPTSEAGKLDKSNPMLAESGINDAPVNDIFRAVHDFFGHAKEGYQFGPRGEFNAWRAHSEMYSPEAQGALAAETLAQNFWVNYGKHLRDSAGNVPIKGEKGYVAPTDRPFAEQKNVVIPQNFLDEARGVQAQPKKSDDWVMPDKASNGFKKAWITPDGSPIQLGGAYHHDWLAEHPEFGIKVTQAPSMDEDARIEALKKGFVRLNYSQNSGTLTVEGRAKDWPKQRDNVRQFVEANLGDIDNIKIALLDPKSENVVDSNSVKLFNFDEADKIGNVPLLNGETSVARKEVPQAETLRKDTSYNPSDSYFKNQAQPKYRAIVSLKAEDKRKLLGGQSSITSSDFDTREEAQAYADAIVSTQKSTWGNYKDSDFITKITGGDKPTIQAQPKKEMDLPGFEKPQAFSSKEISDMTKDELKAHFPEAIVPKKRDESIPSDIVGSPLFKQSGDEARAVDAFAKKMVDFAKKWESHPVYAAGKQWYSEFAPLMKKEFGADAPLMAELLAATSPQTSVETNFGYALDALHSIKSGRFNKIVTKFQQGLEMLADDNWLSWYNRELKAGNIPQPPANPTEAAFLEAWINKHDLKPRQSNGKLYGQHSLPVLQVFARRWLDLNRGPKTRNFVANLLGDGHEATIDLWADRTMRRLGYEGFKDRWRILPNNKSGVSDSDFAFAQKVYRKAADELKMNPDDLQGALWFAEKQLWADNGWGRLDLGDFRKEMEKVPLLKKGYEQRLKASSAKSKPEQQLEILPRAQR
jgi:hypothetical protein